MRVGLAKAAFFIVSISLGVYLTYAVCSRVPTKTSEWHCPPMSVSSKVAGKDSSRLQSFRDLHERYYLNILGSYQASHLARVYWLNGFRGVAGTIFFGFLFTSVLSWFKSAVDRPPLTIQLVAIGAITVVISGLYINDNYIQSLDERTSIVECGIKAHLFEIPFLSEKELQEYIEPNYDFRYAGSDNKFKLLTWPNFGQVVIYGPLFLGLYCCAFAIPYMWFFHRPVVTGATAQSPTPMS